MNWLIMISLGLLSTVTVADYQIAIQENAFKNYKSFTIQTQISHRITSQIIKTIRKDGADYTIGFIERDGLHIGNRSIEILIEEQDGSRGIMDIMFSTCHEGSCHFSITYDILEKMSRARRVLINHGTQRTNGTIYELDQSFLNELRQFLAEPFQNYTNYSDTFKTPSSNK